MSRVVRTARENKELSRSFSVVASPKLSIKERLEGFLGNQLIFLMVQNSWMYHFISFIDNL